MPTAPLTRADIFRHGLKGATGAITFWDKDRQFGTVTLDGEVPIEYYFHRSKFHESEHHLIAKDVRIFFDAVPGQVDLTLLPYDRKWPKPEAKKCSVIVPEETNFNR